MVMELVGHLNINQTPKIVYFDSNGLPPPSEFVNYMKIEILYSTYNIQKDEKFICGHLCLSFLYEIVYTKKEIMQILINFFSYKNDFSKYIWWSINFK